MLIRRSLFALIFTLITVMIPTPSGFAQVTVARVSSADAWVEKLDADSYYQRRSARQHLLDVTSRSDRERVEVIRALQRGLSHASMEVRLASNELLGQVNQRQIDRDIDRLLNPRVNATDIHSMGWPVARTILGEDLAARKLYAAIYRWRPHVATAVSAPNNSGRTRRLLASIDPYRIAPDDTVQWACLLLLETLRADDANGNLNWRTWMSLSNAQLGIKDTTMPETRVLRRLIHHWLVANQDRCPQRESLLISMRYGCHDRVHRLCREISKDGSSPPATQVMALLCASATGHDDFIRFAHSRLDDQRTAHVWQLIADQKTRIRTQVRDVALALLAHHHGIDPREIGYRDLQADPLLVFRDHSLGFTDDSRREQSHRLGLARLGIAGQ